MHLEARGIYEPLPFQEIKMQSYPKRIDVVLGPDEYSDLRHITIKREPFICYTLRNMADQGYSLGINARYLESHDKTKLTFRLIKKGDSTTSSFSFFTSLKMWSVELTIKYLKDVALLNNDMIFCKNLSNSMKKLYAQEAISSAGEIYAENKVLVKKNTEQNTLIQAYQSTVAKLSDRIKELEDELELERSYNRPSFSVPTLDKLIAGFDEEAVLRAYNDRRAATLSVPKPTVPHYETLEEAFKAIEDTATDDQSPDFLQSLVEIFGEETASEFLSVDA